VGTLYVVGTPIGNLEDISPRAVDVLGAVSLVAAENPQRTQRLLARYGIQVPMMRYTDAYERKKQVRLEAVLAALEAGDVALVSEAGMPGLADPGYELLAAALARGVAVVPVPGPTALAAALSVAGLAVERFAFLGFLPRRRAARRALLEEAAALPLALVAYEAPHRLVPALEDLDAVAGERLAVAASELTKLYEEVRRGTPAQLLAHFRQHSPRGEYTLVVSPPGPAPGPGGREEPW
jgi:16S rRNA (cytidine1402-2'-O)-methyltransferase